jgi:hypothetical protein
MLDKYLIRFMLKTNIIFLILLGIKSHFSSDFSTKLSELVLRFSMAFNNRIIKKGPN